LLIGNNAIEETNTQIVKNIHSINPGVVPTWHYIVPKNPLPDFICGFTIFISLKKILKEVLISHTQIWIETIVNLNIRISVKQFSKFFFLTLVPYLEYFLKKVDKANRLKIKEVGIQIHDETNFSVDLVIINEFGITTKEETLETFYPNDIFKTLDTKYRKSLNVELDLQRTT